MPKPWLWGVVLGVVVGAGVVAVNSMRHGFSAPLLLLGTVLTIAFGALGLAGAVVSGRTHLD
jgi:hypothetical protein